MDEFEDEEEQLKRLRESSTYKGQVKKENKKPQAETKQSEVQYVASSADKEKLSELDLPVSFGKKSNQFDFNAVLEKTKRGPGPQRAPGPQRPSSSSVSNQREDEDQPSRQVKRSVEEDDDEIMGPPKPPPPKVSETNPSNAASDDDDDMIGPPKPSNISSNTKDEIEVYADEESNFYSIPYSNEAILQNQMKPISAIAIDPSGSRLITGSYDSTLSFWDFAGMNTSLKSFRNITPYEGSQIKSIQYSSTGDCFLVATTNWQV